MTSCGQPLHHVIKMRAKALTRLLDGFADFLPVARRLALYADSSGERHDHHLIGRASGRPRIAGKHSR